MNWRSPKLLRIAREAPYCFHCLAQNTGRVVACHSNQQRDGKGMSIKAHDYRIAFMCDECHFVVDRGPASREVKQGIWEAAHRATIGWLIENGKLVVA